MPSELKYMPTFRARQQEILVLSSFDFGQFIYPCIEIVKEFDRERQNQKTFESIYSELVGNIRAHRVFLDLPLYLKETGSMQKEILSFNRGIISDRSTRTSMLQKFSHLRDKIIPVIYSYLLKTGETNTIQKQVKDLRPSFQSIAFRLMVNTFESDWPDVIAMATRNDFIILDLDTIPPYATSPVLRKTVQKLTLYNTFPKIVLRSAINTDIQNISLEHGSVVLEADNSLVETYRDFTTNAFGDYAGIKKDDLTAGGTISPGFIYYDAVENQYYGFKASYKSLDEFQNRIVPDVIASPATQRMQASGREYLTEANWGWQTLNNIQNRIESGKSQAKFKRIAMEHYLYTMRLKAIAGDFN